MASQAEVHFEPFLHLVDVGAEEALIAWGGFYFRRGDSPYGEWRIVDDEELREVAGERTGTVGFSSEPYGEAVVEVERDGQTVATVETAERNHAWVSGLEPATGYSYRVRVDGEPWAEGELLDWDLERRTLLPSGRRYENRFRTFPAATAHDPVRFAVLGDFGVGILAVDAKTEETARHQMHLARALERTCDTSDVLLVLTTGDNVYLDTTGSGNEDDDWYASFYEPYRYVINRVPVFPTVGNHDAEDTESSDDRDQLADNFFLEQRFRPGVEAGRASLEPGLFYCLRVGAQAELICIDTSLGKEIGREHFFDDPAHAEWVRSALHTDGDKPRWRIPFSHHPPFCAGPEHGNTTSMIERLVPLFESAGVQLVLSGHEHNFQHSRVDGIDYIVSGAAGKLRTEPPTGFDAAHTRAWAAAGHILVVDLEDERAVVHPVQGVGEDGSLEEIELTDPDGKRLSAPIEIAAR
jgi:tartrate-resistant acid phosphatase type 5